MPSFTLLGTVPDRCDFLSISRDFLFLLGDSSETFCSILPAKRGTQRESHVGARQIGEEAYACHVSAWTHD